MLVLGRQPGDKVIIEIPPSMERQTVTVTFLDHRQNGVRLGFEAPKSINIAREEVYQMLPHLEDKTLDCGSLGQITPTGFVDAIRAASVDDDAEPLPRFMTPMMKLDWATRGIDNPKNHHHED